MEGYTYDIIFEIVKEFYNRSPTNFIFAFMYKTGWINSVIKSSKEMHHLSSYFQLRLCWILSWDLIADI
jgi:hypothetical protein